MKNYIKQNKLEKLVKLLNFTKNPFPYIKKSQLFILSSTYEGLPNVLLEALVLRKFIISSNCQTGPSEILLNGNGGLLFKVKDHRLFRKKFCFFLKTKEMSNSIKKLY